MAKPTVAVLGSGDVGRRLAEGFASKGHKVVVGSREPNSAKLVAWRSGVHGDITTESSANAAKAAQVIVLATEWTGTENAIKLAGVKNFAGKTVIDVTNPLAYREDLPPELVVGHNDSAGERIQAWLPEANVVKAFNIVGNQFMVDPDLPGGPPTMFIAGDDESAKKVVADALDSFGWETSDLGGIHAARYLEPMAMVWVMHGFQTGSWDHAFKLLRK